MAFDPSAQALLPLGIGQIANTKLTSLDPLPLERLDYIGVAYVSSDLQPLLAECASAASGSRNLGAIIGALLRAGP